jgi:hypothetical protein
MEAKSDQPFVKKADADQALSKFKAQGGSATSPVMLVRCPKRGMRWRMRVDQWH